MIMNKRLEDIQRRRRYLVVRAETQRSELAYLSWSLRKPLRYVDLAMNVANFFRTNPALMAIAASVFLITPRHRLLLWAGRIVTGWELYQFVRQQRSKRD